MQKKNVVVKKSCHSRVSLSGIPTTFNNTQGGDPRQKPSGMTPLFDNGLTTHGFILRPTSPRKVAMRDIGAAHTLYPALQACGETERVAHGFTLIELLVVVLIIGILAAVALPQYQKAVKKSYFVSAFPALKSTVQAQELFALENGKYATSEPLLITTPRPKEVSINNNFNNLGVVRIIYCPGKTANEVCDMYATKQVVIADIYLSQRDLLSSDISDRAGQKHCVSRNKHGYLCDAFCEAFGPCSMVNRN